MSVRSTCLIRLCLLIFWLFVLSVTESKVLKFPATVVDFSTLFTSAFALLILHCFN